MHAPMPPESWLGRLFSNEPKLGASPDTVSPFNVARGPRPPSAEVRANEPKLDASLDFIRISIKLRTIMNKTDRSGASAT